MPARQNLAIICLCAMPLFVYPQDSLNVRFVGGYPFGVSYWQTGGIVEGHGYVFFQSGSGLIILNVDNPENPVKVGQILSPILMNPFLKDTLLYCAGYSRGLLIYNVKNPSQPILLGNCPTTDLLFRVFVLDTFAYGLYPHQLIIFNVSDPANPYIISTWDPPEYSFPQGIYVRGHYIYTCGPEAYPYAGRLFILDVSDITNPLLIGELPFIYSQPHEITVAGDYAYLDVGEIINISDPTNPYLVGNTHVGGFLLWENNYVYYGCGGSGICIVDVSNPYSPFVVGGCNEAPAGMITKIGDYLFGNSGTDINVFDVSEPVFPFKVGEEKLNAIHTIRVKILGNIAIVSDYYDPSVGTIDITNPQGCFEMARFYINHHYDAWTPEIAVQGNYVYVTALDSGLRVLDISDPFNIVETGHCYIPGFRYVMAVDVQGDYAYVISSGNYGLGVVDISNPQNPYLVAGIPYFGGHSIFVAGDYAYCASDSGLKIISIANPYNPYIISECNFTTYCDYIYVSNNYTFVRDPINNCVTIIDVSNPYSPYIVSHIPHSGKPYVSGNLLYLACDALRIYDISNPAWPLEIGYYKSINLCGELMPGYDVIYANGYIYLTTGYYGLWILEYYGQGVQEKISPTLSSNLMLNSISRKISFSLLLNRPSRVKIALFDITGRRVYYETNNTGSGIHNKEINCNQLSAGIYFLRVETEDWLATKKVVLLK